MFKTEKEYHAATEHSYKSVRMNSGFLDWGTQPSAFKSYPKFYPRFKLNQNEKIGALLLMSAKITYEKHYGKDSYFLRVQPSAGALYPTELYAQIRGESGWIDGIYHFDVRAEELVLIYQLNNDGLESVAGLTYCVKGVLLLIGSPYFRSSWKYKNRAFRYCLLDCGHQYGAIEFASYLDDIRAEAVFEFDKSSVGDFMGFENKEFAVMMAICGEKLQKPLKKPTEKLPFVMATDYFEPNEIIENAFEETKEQIGSVIETREAKFSFDKEALLKAILTRRSIRAFFKRPITKEEYEEILICALEPITSGVHENLDIFAVINNVTDMQNGVYKNKELIKSGDFANEAGYLCLEQAIGKDGAITFFVTSRASSYQIAVISAGIFGHRLYIAAAALGIGASGIGAYYDQETKKFLDTTNDILYAVAIGR